MLNTIEATEPVKKMNNAMGEMKITFGANISKKELLEKFSEFLFESGQNIMKNVQGDETVLDIYEVEYLSFDEESDYEVDE